MRSLVAPVVFLQGKKYSGTKTTEKENLWRLEQMALQGTNLEHFTRRKQYLHETEELIVLQNTSSAKNNVQTKVVDSPDSQNREEGCLSLKVGKI